MDDATLQRLADRADIIDCLHRYARGMDRLDRELARSAYHGDAIDDHAGFVGDVEGFLDWAFAYHGTQRTHQHYITNHHIELDGDVAHVESYYLFVATLPDQQAELPLHGGRYIDRFERRDGRWAIAARTLVPEWRTELDPPADAGAAARAHVRVTPSSRDRSDVSYQRPLAVEPLG